MPFYFSYDAVIPDYKEEESFYSLGELHCTLAYSRADINPEQVKVLQDFKINPEQTCIVKDVGILSNHIVLFLSSENLNEINKDIINRFSIQEDYPEKIMHVSIRKGAEDINLENLKSIYVGKSINLHNPKLFIKDSKTKEQMILNLKESAIKNKIKSLSCCP